MTNRINFGHALLLLLPALILTTNCKDMKLDIQDYIDRLDTIEGTTITSISEQIDAINSSISELQKVDTKLDGYIKTLGTTAENLQKQLDDTNAGIMKVKSELGEEITSLEQSLLNELNTAKEAIETELEAIYNTLDELRTADIALSKRIDDLQSHIDTQLEETKDWADATFSTLAQYAETQTEISAIKALIEQTNRSLKSLETSLTEKMANDIKAAIEALHAELSADYIAKIENAVNTMTEAYTIAISSAKEELTTAYTTAISTAIAESETGMKAWVNEQLTQGYYDIATLDGMLSALSTRLDETDADLQKQIAKQKSALETTKTDLTKAYKTAISDAITENNGVINGAIAEAVQNLDDEIQAKLTVIDTHITNIQKQLTNISKDIASIFEQIAGISSSISELRDTDRELESYIDALKSEQVDMNMLIEALQVESIELTNQIVILQDYIDTELQETVDWTEATFATLEQYSAIQTEISAIKILIDKTKEDITAEYTAGIESAISNSETGMKSWVNIQLAQGYYNIATIDGKLSAIESLMTDGDSNLLKQIDEQKTALQQAKTDLTNEYKQYINTALANGGIIDNAISSQIKTAQDNLQAQIGIINDRLSSLEDRLSKLETDFVNRIQSLKYIPEYSDGKAKISEVFKITSIDLLISPSNLSSTIPMAWEYDKDIVNAYLRTTKFPETEAISNIIPMSITSVIAKDDGTLNLIIEEDAENPINSEFFAGKCGAVIYIKISDGNNDIFSDIIEVEPGFDNSVFEDLSPLIEGVPQTANSYIVNKAGHYKFKAYKGNSDILAGQAHPDNHPTGDIDHASVLWETFGTSTEPETGDLIKSISQQGEFIYFSTSPEFLEGNAVIAAKDAIGNILWSWHIWFTDTPEEQIYYNNAGTMMDRNLGATSTTPNDIKALGLLYQWGRKDPFLGASSNIEYTAAKSTIRWPSPTISESTTGTIEYAISNPTTFIYVPDYNNEPHWLYGGNGNLWKSNKTIYDPCPAGWHVPDVEVWEIASGHSEGFMMPSDMIISEYIGTNLSGILGEASLIWYPQGCILSVRTATLKEGERATCNLTCNGLFLINGKVWCNAIPCSPPFESTGYPVRCQKE